MNKEKLSYGEPESFFTTARRANDRDVVEVTIPMNLCKVLGIEIGDQLKVWVKKVKKEE